MIEEFYKLKPLLNNKQHDLYSAFLRIGAERRYEQSAPMPILEREIDYFIDKYGCCNYPPDIFTTAIKLIDSAYTERKHAEIMRKNNKG